MLVVKMFIIFMQSSTETKRRTRQKLFQIHIILFLPYIHTSMNTALARKAWYSMPAFIHVYICLAKPHVFVSLQVNVLSWVQIRHPSRI